MSESAVGVSVALTRQNSGSPRYAAPPRPPPAGANPPAGTVSVSVIVVSESLSPLMPSHETTAANASPRMMTAIASADRTVAVLFMGRYYGGGPRGMGTEITLTVAREGSAILR